jgi:hypothetical protein
VLLNVLEVYLIDLCITICGRESDLEDVPSEMKILLTVMWVNRPPGEVYETG